MIFPARNTPLPSADDLTQQFESNGLIGRDVETLSEEERLEIRNLWRDGVMAFLEGDMLKEKYRVVEGTRESFIQSGFRPKWDILQK